MMNRFTAIVLLPVAVFGCGGKDINVNEHPPEVGVSPTSIDFGEVVLGRYGEIGILVTNEGYGTLEITSATLSGLTSAEYTIVSYPTELAHGEEGVLSVRYTPTAEGEDWGEVDLVTNDEVVGTLLVPLTASGVKPQVDVDPQTLSYMGVPPMSYAVQNVSIGAVGSGDLVIFGMTVTGDGAAYYTFASDEYYDGVIVPNGSALLLDLTFAPLDELEQDAQLQINTNDPENEVSIVQLFGNVLDDPNTNSPPQVEITGPNNGEYFVDDVATTLTGHVVDTDDDVTTLVCTWYINGAPWDPHVPDADGTITTDPYLPAGATMVSLECVDQARDYGEDTVVLTVWEHDEPMQYVISGGPTEFDYIAVDDDLEIYLNGVVIYTDDNHDPSNIPPIAFDAVVGDELRIRVTDADTCDANASAMYLHFGTGSSQPLTDEICFSACPTHPCYDETYDGPWPVFVLDETYTIAIP